MAKSKREVSTNIAFVFGNGESRKNYDPMKFRSKGTVVGCNAMYRDCTPDILVASDAGIISEIVHSGYSRKNRCYFRGWSPLPSSMKQMFIDNPPTPKIIDRVGDAPQFVMMGHHGNIWESFNEKTSYTYMTGVYDDDKSKDLKEIGCDIITKEGQQETYEFAGPTAVDLAAKFCEDVFLLGFDFKGHKNNKVNNIYKDTNNYLKSEDEENWKLARSIIELEDVVRRNDTTIFWRVGNDNPGTIPELEQLDQYANFIFISYEEMHEFLGVDSGCFLKGNP